MFGWLEPFPEDPLILLREENLLTSLIAPLAIGISGLDIN